VYYLGGGKTSIEQIDSILLIINIVMLRNLTPIGHDSDHADL
jgi:hypothetical protein